MEDQSAQGIDPLLAASDIEEEQRRLTRRRWMWILAGLGAFVVFSVVMLGLLATLVVPNVLNKYSKAVTKKTEVDITSIEFALQEFATANGGKFPDSLEVLVTPDAHGKTFLEANHVPKDPWGREYLYEPPGPGNPQPIVRSYGKDGRPGGMGDDADIDNLSIRGEGSSPVRRAGNR